MGELTWLSPSRAIAMQAAPGLLLQNFAGRLTWAEFEAGSRVMIADGERSLGRRYVTLARIAPTGIGQVPDEAFRRNVGQLMRGDHVAKVAAFAYIIVGEGFMAATSRAVVAGVSALTRVGYPQRTFAEPEPAATWLAGQLEQGPRVWDIVARLDALVRQQERAAAAITVPAVA